MGRKLELAIGVLNGAIGDHLARTGNGLATELAFVHEGEPIAIDELARVHGRADGGPALSRVAVLLHGLMCTEDIFRFPDGRDYGALLAEEFGYTPLYVRYNTGLAISENGRAFDALLSALCARYEVEEILPLGYSMGGLVVRSACHHDALHEPPRWLPKVRRAFYVGTPHLGAPLERAGRVLSRLLSQIPDPYANLVADIADVRSAGIKDLGDAALRDQDRGADGFLGRPEHPVPLLPSIRHHLVAGSLSREPWLTELFGDTIVPLSSGTNGHRAGPRALPPRHVKVMPGLSHMDIAHHPEVWAQLQAWLRESEEP